MGKDLSTSSTNEKELKTFLQYLTKLDFTQFCGVCRMVGVDIIQASDSEAGRELKNFDQLLEEAIDGFCFLRMWEDGGSGGRALRADAQRAAAYGECAVRDAGIPVGQACGRTLFAAH